jgi:hypothetical protein
MPFSSAYAIRCHTIHTDFHAAPISIHSSHAISLSHLCHRHYFQIELPHELFFDISPLPQLLIISFSFWYIISDISLHWYFFFHFIVFSFIFEDIFILIEFFFAIFFFSFILQRLFSLYFEKIRYFFLIFAPFLLFFFEDWLFDLDLTLLILYISQIFTQIIEASWHWLLSYLRIETDYWYFRQTLLSLSFQPLYSLWCFENIYSDTPRQDIRGQFSRCTEIFISLINIAQ